MLNNIYSILVNGVVFKEDKVLVSQRSFEEGHEGGKWTIPGGKAESEVDEEFDLLEKNLQKEIREETGVEIEDKVELLCNNTFLRSNGQPVLALVFKCIYKSGEPQALEDTIDCKWATEEEIEKMEFPPNVKDYILKAFSA